MAKICSRVLAVRKNWGGNSDFDKIREYQGTSGNLIIRHGKY